MIYHAKIIPGIHPKIVNTMDKRVSIVQQPTWRHTAKGGNIMAKIISMISVAVVVDMITMFYLQVEKSD